MAFESDMQQQKAMAGMLAALRGGDPAEASKVYNTMLLLPEGERLRVIIGALASINASINLLVKQANQTLEEVKTKLEEMEGANGQQTKN
jgi:hypothetical protein